MRSGPPAGSQPVDARSEAAEPGGVDYRPGGNGDDAGRD